MPLHQKVKRGGIVASVGHVHTHSQSRITACFASKEIQSCEAWVYVQRYLEAQVTSPHPIPLYKWHVTW